MTGQALVLDGGWTAIPRVACGNMSVFALADAGVMVSVGYLAQTQWRFVAANVPQRSKRLPLIAAQR